MKAAPNSRRGGSPPIFVTFPYDKFKSATGTWECSGCFCRNPDEVTQCPLCLTMNYKM